MNRSDLGDWGAGLPPDELASALAAALILSARPLPRLWHMQSVGINARELLDLVRNAGTPSGAVPARLDVDLIRDWPPAQLLRQAWGSMLEDLDYAYYPVRLQLDGWQETDPTWTLDLIRGAAGSTNVTSAYLLQAPQGGVYTWHLPMQVGFLPDPASRALHNQLEGHHYDWLTTLVELRPGVETCDLLLLPRSLEDGLDRVAALPFRPDATCTLVLGHDRTPLGSAYPVLEALQARTHGSAIGLLEIPDDERVDWFSDLVRHLSHDSPLDLALFNSVEWRDCPAPLLVADVACIANARLSTTAMSIIEQLVSRASAERPVRLPDRLRNTLQTDDVGLTEDDGTLPPERFAGFRDRVVAALDAHEFRFDAESGDATDFLELNYAMRELAAPPPQATREAQVRVQHLGDPEEPRLETKGLVMGETYGFDVRVAAPDPDWLGAPKPFPDTEIDFSSGPVELTVVFSEPGLCPEPLVDQILLAKSGSSTECRFVTTVPGGLTGFKARIAFVYRNRVLQTLLVTGTIVARAADLAEFAGDPIAVTLETVVGPGFDQMADRRQFDAALVLNHSLAGDRLAMALVDDKASWVKTDKHQRTVGLIREMLTGMSWDIQSDQTLYASLDAPETNALLLDLAINGAELYQGLIADWGLEALKDARRIQVVSTDFERFFPLEFLYDREIPDDDARLCLTDPEQLAAALERGSCPESCPDDMRKVICPLGFWCLRCVIERHTFDPGRVPGDQGDYALIPEGPLGDTPPLRPLESAVFGASRRVDNAVAGLRDAVMSALEGLVTKGAGRAETWTEWETRVKEIAPSLLLLIPHTVEERHKRAMEIGQQARLIGARIRRAHVRASDDQPPPVVFLLGCETGVDNVDFDSFVAGFRRARAALVVTTLSTVLGRHVAPIALSFLEELSSLSRPEPFGEIALAVRQKLFAEGMVPVLTLAVYGDADWLIER